MHRSRQYKAVFLLMLLLGAMGSRLCTAQSSASHQPSEAPANTSDHLQEVTVTANRIELEKRVSKFVYQIAATQNAEGLARWRVPVCPNVAGLSTENDDFTRNRIVEIAKTAGISTAEDPCRPNLFIFVTSDAVQFFAGMTMRTRLLTFGGAHPGVIDEFIRTPRPVRAWYKTNMFTPDGRPLGDTDRTEVSDWVFGVPLVQPETSYARISAIWGIKRVLIVVDEARLRGVALSQFADYMALTGLAQIKLGARLGDAPSILKLFDGMPQDAPASMSDWDRAFLKSLYTTESTSKGQRSEIAHTIVREMGH